MAVFTNYLGNNLLDHVLSNAAYTSPTTVYGALFIGDPQGAGTEVSDGGYSRQSLPFAAAASLSASTNADVTFGPFSGSVGTVDYFAIYDASTAGNLLLSGALTTSKSVGADDELKFASGNVTVSFS